MESPWPHHKSKDGIAAVDAMRVFPGSSDPETFDLSADGSRLFVSNEDVHLVSVVDLASGQVVTSAEGGREPEGVTVAPDGETVWVTAETDHELTILDAATGRAIGRVEVGLRSRAVAFLPDGSRAYSTNEAVGTVSVVDVNARRVIATVSLGTGARPMGITVAPGGGNVYVSNGRGGTERDRRGHQRGDALGPGGRPSLGNRDHTGRQEALRRGRTLGRCHRDRRRVLRPDEQDSRRQDALGRGHRRSAEGGDSGDRRSFRFSITANRGAIWAVTTTPSEVAVMTDCLALRRRSTWACECSSREWGWS